MRRAPRLFSVSAQRQPCALYYLQREGGHHAQTDFLAGLGFAALQLAGCAAKPQTTPDYVLTYADNQPAGYPTTQGAQYFADLVQQQTGGKVVIQVKANGEYGSEQQVWEQLAIGGVDFARVSLSVVTDDLPPAQRAAAAVSLPGCRPHVARAGRQHRG